MHLADFLRDHRLTLAGFGALVGVSGVTVHRWVQRKARPSWDNLAAIERVTNGSVGHRDFLPAAHPANDAAAHPHELGAD